MTSIRCHSHTAVPQHHSDSDSDSDSDSEMAVNKLLSVALLLICHTRALFGDKVRGFVVGGQDAPTGSWPWMVHFNITSDGRHTWRCGGTILDNYWILTAAHCWDRKLKPYLPMSVAWFGTNQLQEENVHRMGVYMVVTHSRYQAVDKGFINDIALVKLQGKMNFSQFVHPVSLPCVDHVFTSSSECWLTGWGNIGNNVPLPDPEVLQQVKIPIIPHRVCEKHHPGLTPQQLCAGDMAGGKDACEGDYGGPLMCHGDAGFVQVGITSSGGCGLPGQVGIYTKVSRYLTFINDYVPPRRKNRC
ncbi:tryptase-2-like [Cynoglossus semilaevis]|uniref:Tryptase-2-like n=1 Tax=Cynoglossus semilaevis TaxID=244447 RepID=A0A3P8W4H2_CYNSE|nr:tryptase-2-like [Cynoglossus semilaevis]